MIPAPATSATSGVRVNRGSVSTGTAKRLATRPGETTSEPPQSAFPMLFRAALMHHEKVNSRVASVKMLVRLIFGDDFPTYGTGLRPESRLLNRCQIVAVGYAAHRTARAWVS